MVLLIAWKRFIELSVPLPAVSPPAIAVEGVCLRHKVLIVTGTRPQFIKCAPLIEEILKHRDEIDLGLVNTGQHYDKMMSEVFFEELALPRPVLELDVGSGSHATQTARIMVGMEQATMRLDPELVIVAGDTNTTLGSALGCVKLRIPVAHVEAGMRSYEDMPEETNRRLTDHCSSLLFAPTRTGVRNLYREGIQGKRVLLSGDTMLDLLLRNAPYIDHVGAEILERQRLSARRYVYATVHRAANVDNDRSLTNIVADLSEIADELPIFFAIHPRTRKRMRDVKIRRLSGKLLLHRPVSYLQSISLTKNAALVITDSGGLQKEAFLLGTPCVTVRKNTEWPETLLGGANRLVAPMRGCIRNAFNDALRARTRSRVSTRNRLFGNGKAAVRIAEGISKYLKCPHQYRDQPAYAR